MPQKIIFGADSHRNIEKLLSERALSRFLLVSGKSVSQTQAGEYFSKLSFPHVVFSDFSPNPTYEEVKKGIEVFKQYDCDSIVAVGGGSAIDVAKCIRVFAPLPVGADYLSSPRGKNNIPLIAVPTTAGTGSESTQFAVIYKGGEKQSVDGDDVIPEIAVLDPVLLKTLPLYQKKCTALDALCQAIESRWSVHSTAESDAFADKAIEMLTAFLDGYLSGDEKAAENVLYASNSSGRAINITRTTAPHAMSYKLTTLYGIPHGHAVALSLPKVWKFMLDKPELCIDPRGADKMNESFSAISRGMGAKDAREAIDIFEELLLKLGIFPPTPASAKDVEILASSVNADRLKNNPVKLDKETLIELYADILKVKAL